ncbi:U3 small nucleolar ribonucleoprotein IMP4, partial [Monoraphidium neglectum]
MSYALGSEAPSCRSQRDDSTGGGLRLRPAGAAAMIRRNARLRKEYLYRKSLEGKDLAAYERKRKIRKALEEGKPMPTELRREEAQLRREVELEDDNTAVVRDHVDDEYAHAGERDPK